MSDLIIPIIAPTNIDSWTPKNLEELAVYWMLVYAKNRKAPSSVARDQITLKKYLLPSYGKYPLAQITARNVEYWFLKLVQDSGLSMKSCNDVLGLFKKLLNDATRWGFMDRNPIEFVKKMSVAEKDIDFWNKEEIQIFLGYWLNTKQRPQALWSMLLALYTGMRRGEILGLKWDAVDFSSGFITVKRSFCKAAGKVREETKSKKIRRIPICKALRSHLQDLALITRSSGYVIPHMHSDSFLKIFRRMSRTAGIKEIRFHDLRHTFASHFLMSGGSIYDLRQILGHSTIQVTERYTHFVPDHLQGKTEILDF